MTRYDHFFFGTRTTVLGANACWAIDFTGVGAGSACNLSCLDRFGGSIITSVFEIWFCQYETSIDLVERDY